MNHEGGRGLAALKTKNHEGGAGGGCWSPAQNQEPIPGLICAWVGGVVQSDSDITAVWARLFNEHWCGSERNRVRVSKGPQARWEKKGRYVNPTIPLDFVQRGGRYQWVTKRAPRHTYIPTVGPRSFKNTHTKRFATTSSSILILVRFRSWRRTYTHARMGDASVRKLVELPRPQYTYRHSRDRPSAMQIPTTMQLQCEWSKTCMDVDVSTPIADGPGPVNFIIHTNFYK